MVKRSSHRWGIFFYAAACVLVAGGFAYPLWFPRSAQPFFYDRVLPYAGLVLSALALFAGHFSYPRIQNLKVYLAGYLIGLTGASYFVLCHFAGGIANRVAVTTLVFALNAVNAVTVTLVPSYVKYRLTRKVTWTIAALELAAILVVAFVPEAASLLRHLSPEAGTRIQCWIGPAAAAAALGTSLWLVRHEFHLGGVLAGTALIQALAWGGWFFSFNATATEMLLMCAGVLFFLVGSVIHWFVRMEHRIAYDPLLHIYNREFCTRVLAEQSRVDTRPPFGIAMLDIDHFKKVNDTHGHQAGDHVLVGIAQAVSRCVVPDGVLCRYGGEELAVFFPQMTTKEVVPILEDVRTTVEKTRIAAGKKKLSVTISSGLSQRESLSQPLSDVLAAADKALYRAKKSGRNQVKTSKTPVNAGKRK